MTVALGEPVWTEGGFNRVAALDDLGIESVGASLLRRLLPGIVQTTPNAGYFSFYPYLVARWEDFSDSVRRVDFKEFYRRREAAYALACSLHDHRGALYGVNGSSKAAHALAGDPVRIAAFAAPDAYMQSAYGGYGLFYARVIADVRLTDLGATGYVDRVTDRGRAVAEAFAETFEETEYYQRYVDADEIPAEVLAELGDATCLCTIPGRTDHKALVDTFFGAPEEDPAWDDRRRTRMRSIGLFLEAHEQRPPAVSGTVGMWRRMLLSSRFGDGIGWETSFDEQRDAWRAYQLREVLVIALTSLWSSYLEALDQIGPTTHSRLRRFLSDKADWAAVGIAEGSSLAGAIGDAEVGLAAPEDLIVDAERLSRTQILPLGERVASAFRLALRVRTAMGWTGPGFDPLLSEGGPGRWSLEKHAAWLDARDGVAAVDVFGELVDALYFQHRRIALSKVSPTDHRDPFCVAEDNGVLTHLRPDEPFWTGARYAVVNHLLWTLGAIEDPSGDAALTSLGVELLERCRNA